MKNPASAFVPGLSALQVDNTSLWPHVPHLDAIAVNAITGKKTHVELNFEHDANKGTIMSARTWSDGETPPDFIEGECTSVPSILQ
jgi:hypothetical protein